MISGASVTSRRRLVTESHKIDQARHCTLVQQARWAGREQAAFGYALAASSFRTGSEVMAWPRRQLFETNDAVF